MCRCASRLPFSPLVGVLLHSTFSVWASEALKLNACIHDTHSRIQCDLYGRDKSFAVLSCCVFSDIFFYIVPFFASTGLFSFEQIRKNRTRIVHLTNCRNGFDCVANRIECSQQKCFAHTKVPSLFLWHLKKAAFNMVFFVHSPVYASLVEYQAFLRHRICIRIERWQSHFVHPYLSSCSLIQPIRNYSFPCIKGSKDTKTVVELEYSIR